MALSLMGSGAQALATAGAAGGDDLAAADSRDASAEAVTALAHQFAGLIGTLHGSSPLPGNARLKWHGSDLAQKPENTTVSGRTEAMRLAGRVYKGRRVEKSM
jgi:hypothetical protein